MSRNCALGRLTAPLRILSRRPDAPGELDAFWAQEWPNTRVIRCTLSQNPPEAHQRRTAETLNADWHEMEAGHYPMLSHPDELVGLLV